MIGERDGRIEALLLSGRYAVTERTGVALRAEYVDIDNFNGPGSDLSVWGLTSTVDYKLTDDLTVRGEVRYDSISDGGDLFVTDNSFGVNAAEFDEDDQITAGVEVIYTF